VCVRRVVCVSPPPAGLPSPGLLGGSRTGTRLSIPPAPSCPAPGVCSPLSHPAARLREGAVARQTRQGDLLVGSGVCEQPTGPPPPQTAPEVNGTRQPRSPGYGREPSGAAPWPRAGCRRPLGRGWRDPARWLRGPRGSLTAAGGVDAMGERRERWAPRQQWRWLGGGDGRRRGPRGEAGLASACGAGRRV